MKLVFVEIAIYYLIDPIQAPCCMSSLLIKNPSF
jgi:hypothetical protein